jgi:hypothetical protein
MMLEHPHLLMAVSMILTGSCSLEKGKETPVKAFNRTLIAVELVTEIPGLTLLSFHSSLYDNAVVHFFPSDVF